MQKVIERLRAVPEGQQDQLAEFLLHELSEDERWIRTSEAHTEGLKRLVDGVLADDAKGLCDPLDPDRM